MPYINRVIPAPHMGFGLQIPAIWEMEHNTRYFIRKLVTMKYWTASGNSRRRSAVSLTGSNPQSTVVVAMGAGANRRSSQVHRDTRVGVTRLFQLRPVLDSYWFTSCRKEFEPKVRLLPVIGVPPHGVPADCIPAHSIPTHRVPTNCIPTHRVPSGAAPRNGLWSCCQQLAWQGIRVR